MKFNFQKKIKFSDLTEAASATAESVVIAKIPADSVVEKVAYYLETEFSGGSVSALTIEAGDEDDSNGYIGSKSVLTGATPISSAYNDGAYLNDGTTANTINGKHYDNSAEKTLSVTFSPTGDALANLEAGVLVVKAKVLDLTKEL